MTKPINPYREDTTIWRVMQGSLDAWPEGGWSDLTTAEIAEVLGANLWTVRNSIRTIRIDTGYRVPFVDQRGRPNGR